MNLVHVIKFSSEVAGIFKTTLCYFIVNWKLLEVLKSEFWRCKLIFSLFD